MSHHLSAGTLVANFTNVLTIIMRLRQVQPPCCQQQQCKRWSALHSLCRLQPGGAYLHTSSTPCLCPAAALSARATQVCNSSALCPEALQLLRSAAAAAAGANPQGPPPPPELLAKLLAAVAADADAGECAICVSPLDGPCITPCGHVFCRGCAARSSRPASLQACLPLPVTVTCAWHAPCWLTCVHLSAAVTCLARLHA